ncbi:hypothetical protein [Pseudactinotalea suaedae]|uniref:hypothetical protein n=1 Tax=Pseudactinotalea suaedae TaxID=1524924 RepID=UPI0012E2CC24|nr:hypothetical protein [Pseudactinotalea suaedae]
MSSLSENLGAFARGGAQLLRFPTAFLLGWATLVLVVLTWQVWALLAPAGGPGGLGTALLIAFLALLALPVLVLGLRRRRWLRLTEAPASADRPTVVVGSQELIRIDSLSDKVEDDMTGIEGEEDVRAVMDAFTEVQLPEVSRRGAGARMTRMFGVGRLAVIGRVFGRMERAQRALLTAAGGPTKAPYLVDDLRVTVAAFVGTLLTIGVGGLSILVLAAVLLSR